MPKVECPMCENLVRVGKDNTIPVHYVTEEDYGNVIVCPGSDTEWESDEDESEDEDTVSVLEAMDYKYEQEDE